MNFLNQIYRTYIDIDRFLEEQARDEAPAEISWSRKAELNSYAYFVMLFGQLEHYINDQYEQLIGPWEGAAFIHRVNYLYSEDARTYLLIVRYYNLRNNIAHGHAEEGQMGERVNIRDLYRNLTSIIDS